MIRYANQSVEQIDLAEIAVPYLENLQNTVDETIHLGILNNNEILYINKLEPKNQTIRMSSKVGITRPLYNSAMGKSRFSRIFGRTSATIFRHADINSLYRKYDYQSLAFEKELKQVQQTGLLTMMKKLNKIFSVAEYL